MPNLRELIGFWNEILFYFHFPQDISKITGKVDDTATDIYGNSASHNYHITCSP